MISDSTITAIANQIWITTELLLAWFATTWLRKQRSPAEKERRESYKAAIRAANMFRIGCLAAAGHRLAWNITIWLAPEGFNYNPALFELRHGLIILVLVIAFANWHLVETAVGSLTVRARVWSGVIMFATIVMAVELVPAHLR